VSIQPLRYDVRELWYAIRPHGWTSLAVVSPQRTPKTMRLAQSLAEFGRQAGAGLMEPIDATELDLARVAAITRRLAPRDSSGSGEGRKFIVGLDSPIVNPIAAGVAAACDSALLLLLRTETTIPDARRTVEVIGRGRLLGAVIASD
jgi:hypothetical protein